MLHYLHKMIVVPSKLRIYYSKDAFPKEGFISILILVLIAVSAYCFVRLKNKTTCNSSLIMMSHAIRNKMTANRAFNYDSNTKNTFSSSNAYHLVEFLMDRIIVIMNSKILLSINSDNIISFPAYFSTFKIQAE